jgi:hypothetical protein
MAGLNILKRDDTIIILRLGHDGIPSIPRNATTPFSFMIGFSGCPALAARAQPCSPER